VLRSLRSLDWLWDLEVTNSVKEVTESELKSNLQFTTAALVLIGVNGPPPVRGWSSTSNYLQVRPSRSAKPYSPPWLTASFSPPTWGTLLAWGAPKGIVHAHLKSLYQPHHPVIR